MDIIELGLGQFMFANGPQPSAVVTVRVNGIDLRALVGEAIRQEPIPEQPSGWIGDDPHDDWLTETTSTAFMFLEDVAPPSRHWLGQPRPGRSESGRAAVLTCTCGDFGCGGVATLIAVDAETVTWSDFSLANTVRGFSLRGFEFSRSQYEHALQNLSS